MGAAQEAVNPNNPVGNEAVAESKIGEPTSFEQLENITDQQISEAARTRAKEKSRERADKRADKERSGAKAHGEDGEFDDRDAGSSQEAQSEADGDYEADANAEPSLGIQADRAEVKLIKANAAGEHLDIPADAAIPVKVDGESTDVPLQELINSYSGKVSWDKKFSELGTEKKKFQTDRELVEDRARKILELATNDPLECFTYLAEFAGKDPVDTYKDIMTKMSEAFEQFNSLDEIGRDKLFLDKEKNFFDRRKKSEETVKERQAREQQALQQKQFYQETFGLDDSTYDALVSEIEQAGLVQDGEIRSDHVAEFSRWKMVDQALKNAGLDKPDQKLFTELVDVACKNPEFDTDDIAEIVSEVFGSKASKNLSRKVRQTQAASKAPAKQQQNEPVRPQSEPDVWSFEQL